jgi:hypothetical protein
MAGCSNRGCGYKFGVVLLFLAVGAYIVGFGSPFWIVVHASSRYFPGVFHSQGLWMQCAGSDDEMDCSRLKNTFDFDDLDDFETGKSFFCFKSFISI